MMVENSKIEFEFFFFFFNLSKTTKMNPVDIVLVKTPGYQIELKVKVGTVEYAVFFPQA
jgi:hypothetical protein